MLPKVYKPSESVARRYHTRRPFDLLFRVHCLKLWWWRSRTYYFLVRKVRWQCVKAATAVIKSLTCPSSTASPFWCDGVMLSRDIKTDSLSHAPLKWLNNQLFFWNMPRKNTELQIQKRRGCFRLLLNIIETSYEPRDVSTHRQHDCLISLCT